MRSTACLSGRGSLRKIAISCWETLVLIMRWIRSLSVPVSKSFFMASRIVSNVTSPSGSPAKKYSEKFRSVSELNIVRRLIGTDSTTGFFSPSFSRA